MLSSKVHHGGPSTSLFLYWVARIYCWLFGWNVAGQIPEGVDKAVVIAAPHTSNWDFPHMVATAWIYRLHMGWMGKHSLFSGSFGWFFRWMGGIPVDRRAPQGLVTQVANRIKEADRIMVAVPPSGTRSKKEFWKGGFYWIALEAQVPILLGYLDFSKNEGGIGGMVMPTGDVKADMDKIRAFYADKVGKFPEKQTRIALRDEEAEPRPAQPAAETAS